MTLATHSSSSPSTLDWKFSQVFGEPTPGENLQDFDAITTMEFDKTGDYLAVGDRGGRIVIFEKKAGKDVSAEQHSRNVLERLDVVVKKHPEFQFKTEFQSHEPEFDYLRSMEIEEKISKVRWCASPNGSLIILSTNDKTIKLWKVKERKLKKIKEMDLSPFVSSENALLADKSFVSGQPKSSFTNGHSLEWTEKMEKSTITSYIEHTNVPDIEDPTPAKCRKTYAHAHDFNINSISNNSDGATYISADDLRINWWNLEISDQCYNIIDMKPLNMDDLTEVITSAEFHPTHCNLLSYSSSRGFIRLVDMRQSALCDHSAMVLHHGGGGIKTLLTEIVASISDIKFATDGRHILSRDFMNLKLWDLHMGTSPVATYKIHEHLRPKFPDLYNSNNLFDKFDCCLSGNGLHFATGSYSNHLRIFSHVGSNEGVTLEVGKFPIRKSHQAAPRTRRSSLSNLARGFYRPGHDTSDLGINESACDLNAKLLHLAWHPKTNLIACAAGSSLYMYYA